MMSIARGFALLFTEGRPVSGFDQSFRSLATARLLGVPAPVVITAAVYVVARVVLSSTRFGRYVYAMGGNEEATRLSGVNVRLHKTLVYGVCGLTSAVAAVLLTARLNSAQPIAGIMYELDAIAAVVIGGTSLAGGEGGVGGTLIGALIMGVLRNGLNLLGVSSFLQQVVIGLGDRVRGVVGFGVEVEAGVIVEGTEGAEGTGRDQHGGTEARRGAGGHWRMLRSGRATRGRVSRGSETQAELSIEWACVSDPRLTRVAGRRPAPRPRRISHVKPPCPRVFVLILSRDLRPLRDK